MMMRNLLPVVLLVTIAPATFARNVWVLRGLAFSSAPQCATRAAFTADAVLYNATSAPANVAILDVSNGGTVAGAPGLDLLAGDAAMVSNARDFAPAPLWVTHLDIPDGVLIDGRLDWTYIDCSGLPPSDVPVGKIRLPTFSALVPSGASTIHPDVDLGNQHVRVNIGVYNASQGAATATVALYQPACGPAPVVTQTFRIPPLSAQQMSLVPPVSACTSLPAARTARTLAYATVVVDQPGFSWVTTLSNEALPTATIGSSQ